MAFRIPKSEGEDEAIPVQEYTPVGEKLYSHRSDAQTQSRGKTENVYPTQIPSFFNFFASKVRKNCVWELVPAFCGEFAATFWKYWPVLMVVGFSRASSSVLPEFFKQIPIFFVAGVASAISYYLFHRYSCDTNTVLSFGRWLLPDVAEWPIKYWGVPNDVTTDRKKKGTYSNWLLDATVLTVVKVVGQAAGSLLAVIAATELEPFGTLGFPGISGNYDGAGFPYFIPSASGTYVRAGSLLFIAGIIEFTTFLAVHLEFIKIRGDTLKAIYVGLGTSLAYLISFYPTSTPLNLWIPLFKMMYHTANSDQPLAAIFVPPIPAALVAVLMWFFFVRITGREKITPKEK